jgi:hypothetical protein
MRRGISDSDGDKRFLYFGKLVGIVCLGGIIASDRLRAPLLPLEAALRTRLLELLRRADPLVLRYA